MVIHHAGSIVFVDQATSVGSRIGSGHLGAAGTIGIPETEAATGAIETILIGAAIRAGVAVVLLVLLSMIGSALLPSAIRPAKAHLALPISLSLGASAVGLLVWTFGTAIGTWSALPLVGALSVLSLPRVSR